MPGSTQRRLQRLTAHVCDAPADTLVVPTVAGLVRGARTQSGGRAFKGIPYASQSRFRKPTPAAPWEGELDCTQFRECAMQFFMMGDAQPVAEDCLHLNVWTPNPLADASKKAPLPVFVWIHGGGLLFGAGSEALYDGESFSQQGMVVISINYRLGAFGFLAVEGGDDNVGLWDQVEALRWVQANAAAFGGDPSNVTIGGESAGASCCVCLMVSEKANRLFHRAILSSSIAHLCRPREVGLALGRDFASRAGLASNTADDLRALPAKQLLAASMIAKLKTRVHISPGWTAQYEDGPRIGHRPVPVTDTVTTPVSVAGYTFQEDYQMFLPIPVVDGDLLTAPPLDLLKAGAGAHIPVVVGSNREENGYFPDPKRPGYSAPMTWGGVAESRKDVIARCIHEISGLGVDGDELVSMTESIVDVYAATLGVSNDGGPEEWQNLWNLLASDLCFNSSTVLVAQRQQLHQRRTFVYRYDYGYTSPTTGRQVSLAYHGAELPVAFNNLLPTMKKRPQTVGLSSVMHQMWANFIKLGDPNVPGFAPEWKEYSAAEDNMLVFANPITATKYSVDRPCMDTVLKHFSRLFRFQPC